MSSTFNRRQVLAAAATVAAGAAGATVIARPAAANAANAAAVLPPNFAYVAGSDRSRLFLVPPEGGEVVLAGRAREVVSWSRDGSRFAVPGQGGLKTVAVEGAEELQVQVTTTSPVLPYDQLPAFSADGRWLVTSRYVDLNGTAGPLTAYWTDGSGKKEELFAPLTQGFDFFPQIRGDNVLYFWRMGALGVNGPIHLYRSTYSEQSGWSSPTLVSEQAGWVSPDATKIAYVQRSSAPNPGSLMVADIDGSNAVRLSPEGLNGYQDLCWSPDGQYIYFERAPVFPYEIQRIPVAGGDSEFVVLGQKPSFRPVPTRGTVTRVWGQLALDTAIAVSQSRWATVGDTSDKRLAAQAVVVSRGDAFYDALAGSALAADKNAPLLITPPTGLYSHAEDELKRVLAPGGLVYVLGGTAAVPKPIEDRIKILGYQTKRLEGAMMYETAIAINNEITTAPDTVFIATGVEYYDALAAGAAAGSGAWGKAVVILTDGNRMPASSAAYLNALDPTQVNIVLAGGPGAQALRQDAHRGGKLPSWPATVECLELVGATAVETALMIAEATFASPANVAIATTDGWYDALTGGAMIGSRGGPLLLTGPSGLNANLAIYLSKASASLNTAYILGGTAALPQHLVEPVGDRLGAAEFWDYGQIVPDYEVSI